MKKLMLLVTVSTLNVVSCKKQENEVSQSSAFISKDKTSIIRMFRLPLNNGESLGLCAYEVNNPSDDLKISSKVLSSFYANFKLADQASQTNQLKKFDTNYKKMVEIFAKQNPTVINKFAVPIQNFTTLKPENISSKISEISSKVSESFWNHIGPIQNVYKVTSNFWLPKAKDVLTTASGFWWGQLPTKVQDAVTIAKDFYWSDDETKNDPQKDKIPDINDPQKDEIPNINNQQQDEILKKVKMLTDVFGQYEAEEEEIANAKDMFSSLDGDKNTLCPEGNQLNNLSDPKIKNMHLVDERIINSMLE